MHDCGNRIYGLHEIKHTRLSAECRVIDNFQGLVNWSLMIKIFLEDNSTGINHAARLKVGFHYPSSRAEFTGRVDGPRTRVHFLTPVNSARELG